MAGSQSSPPAPHPSRPHLTTRRPPPPIHPQPKNQEEREPPTYISDRRLVKAVVLLQVAAWTCGRRRVLEFDALLLRNVLCYRPEDEGHVTNWLLQHIAAEDGLRQPRFLLKCEAWEWAGDGRG